MQAECIVTTTIPWPSIIIAILGVVIVIYVAVSSGVDTSRRIFGVVLMILWTAIWALLLWVLWRECRQQTAWWMLLIPTITMIIFVALIIIMNIQHT